jgi:hypothetical protein
VNCVITLNQFPFTCLKVSFYFSSFQCIKRGINDIAVEPHLTFSVNISNFTLPQFKIVLSLVFRYIGSQRNIIWRFQCICRNME